MAVLRHHFGDWLKREIERRLVTQEAFAAAAKIPYRTLRVWLQSESPTIRGLNAEKLSRAVGLTREQLAAKIGTPTVAVKPIPRSVEIPFLEKISAANLRIGAGGGGVRSIRFDSKCQFFIEIDGDCMHPVYRHGDVVLFDAAEVERDGFVVGGDYAIQMMGEDGETTFKRVAESREGQIKLVCINKRKHPQVIKIASENIARAGRAIRKLVDVDA